MSKHRWLRLYAETRCPAEYAVVLLADGSEHVCRLDTAADAQGWLCQSGTHWRPAADYEVPVASALLSVTEAQSVEAQHVEQHLTAICSAENAVIAMARRYAAYARAHSVPGSRREELSDLIDAVDDLTATERK